jgi:hypothetical protein
MKDSNNTLGDALHRFFTDYLPKQRAFSPHTLQSYRDSLKFLLQFVAAKQAGSCRLDVEHLTVDQITAFLQNLEEGRKNHVSTRNVRLSAIHSFFVDDEQVGLEVARQQAASSARLLRWRPGRAPDRRWSGNRPCGRGGWPRARALGRGGFCRLRAARPSSTSRASAMNRQVANW